MKRLLTGCLLAFWLICPSLYAEAATPVIRIIPVNDAIGPGLADHLTQVLEDAAIQRPVCVVIELDTPGGLVAALRQIVQAIYACPVPVVVYVAPSGARAASAGVMITMAADIAAMAPGTHIGAAHPVGAGGQDFGKQMSKKVTNDMVAYARGIAEKRGRNADWAEKAVRESVTATAEEALTAGVIDLIAKDMDDLIAQINGRQVADKGTLDLAGARRETVSENLRTRILKTLSNPNIAYILLMIGLAGLYFELSHPGTIFPGVVGGLAIILAFFGMQTLPINAAGILLILLAVVFFILELKVTSYGLLSVAGVVAMVLGSLMLFKDAGPAFQLAWGVLATTVGLVSGFFVLLAALVVRAQRRRVHTGAEGLVGEVGKVHSVDGLEGKVLVHAELWQARFEKPVQVGWKVRVTGVVRLVIQAAPVDDD